ncbi:hypothetical protein EV189_1728 [Motilibacter rhizosphaerae]|uniref:Uncharacterized protein n=1 Tax=Motilibacter rhizosphaerae TaxID=598652 RepID=A0A4Q7NT30_9ACTN|nr:hypothetical protein [Motilibacter rhizosphaerae]RZS89948.1 hypothetical protein EV189_1728 [Motilibacter rhizosphaerae]
MGATTMGARDTSAQLCMRLLQAGIPLSLLCDLTDDGGPSSRDILEHEGQPELAWWSAG